MADRVATTYGYEHRYYSPAATLYFNTFLEDVADTQYAADYAAKDAAASDLVEHIKAQSNYYDDIFPRIADMYDPTKSQSITPLLDTYDSNAYNMVARREANWGKLYDAYYTLESINSAGYEFEYNGETRRFSLEELVDSEGNLKDTYAAGPNAAMYQDYVDILTQKKEEVSATIDERTSAYEKATLESSINNYKFNLANNFTKSSMMDECNADALELAKLEVIYYEKYGKYEAPANEKEGAWRVTHQDRIAQNKEMLAAEGIDWTSLDYKCIVAEDGSFKCSMVNEPIKDAIVDEVVEIADTEIPLSEKPYDELTAADKRQLIADYESAKHTGSKSDISEEDINRYKGDLIESFESEPVRINSYADQQAYEARKAVIEQYKEDLGYGEETVEPVEFDTSNEVTGATSDVTEVPTEHKALTKPDPYAFEKPARPAEMSDADYDAMCKAAEQEHVAKVNNEAADAILRGEYGNGSERIAALEAAGYDYSQVQSVVNDKMSAYRQVATADVTAATTVAAKGALTEDVGLSMEEAMAKEAESKPETKTTTRVYSYSHQQTMEDGTTCKFYANENGDSLARTYYANGELARENIHYKNGDEKRTLYIDGEKAYVERSCGGPGGGYIKTMATYDGANCTNRFSYDANTDSITDVNGNVVTNEEVITAIKPVLESHVAQWNENVEESTVSIGVGMETSASRELADPEIDDGETMSRTTAEQIEADAKAEAERIAAEESAEKPVETETAKTEPVASESEKTDEADKPAETSIDRDRFSRTIAPSGFNPYVDDKGFGASLLNTPITWDNDPDPDV